MHCCSTSIKPQSECACFFKACLPKSPVGSDWSALDQTSFCIKPFRGFCNLGHAGRGDCYVVTSQCYGSLHGSFEGTICEYQLCIFCCVLCIFILSLYLYNTSTYVIIKHIHFFHFLQYWTFNLDSILGVYSLKAPPDDRVDASRILLFRITRIYHQYESFSGFPLSCLYSRFTFSEKRKKKPL